MDIKQIKVTELKPYKNNPRKNEQAVDAVAASIKEFGFKVPIIIDKDYEIVAGHTRLLAAVKLGLAEVPCIIADDLTDDQIKAFRIADNSTAQIAEWDLEKLNIELLDIDFDMSAFGLEEELKKIEKAFAPEIEEDEVPEVGESEPISQLGDIWQLGRHRLMCGDSTDALNYKHLTQGRKIDLVFTDPPYGMKKEAEGVLNDNLNYDKLLEFNKEWIPLTFDALKDTGSWYCWGIDEPLMDIYSDILKPMKRANEIVIRNYITWAKHSAFGINSDLMLSYPRETEKAWFVMKGRDWNNNNAEFFNTKFSRVLKYMQREAEKSGIKPRDITETCGVQMYGHWFTKSQFTIIPRNHYEAMQKKYNGCFLLPYDEIRGMIGESSDPCAELKPYFYNHADGDVGDIGLTDVWRFSVTGEKEREQTGGHATPKPIALCSRAIKSSSRENEAVLDVFGGSGSTLIACEQLNRTCYMLELDPKYVQVILERYVAFKGTSEDVYRINADGTKTKYADIT